MPPGFRGRQFEEKPGERMGGPVNVQCTALAIQQSPSFLLIEEDSSKSCPRYPLVDIEQDESLVLFKISGP